MNKKYAVGLAAAALLFVAAGCSFRSGNNSYTSPTSSTDSQQSAQQPSVVNSPMDQTTPTTPEIPVSQSSHNVVTYTNSGFSPAILNIAQGDTVTFVNNSSGPMWVASDPHPTHTDYPGFDALKRYSPGQSYQFKFTKIGNWGYHDHVNESNTGTISVK